MQLRQDGGVLIYIHIKNCGRVPQGTGTWVRRSDYATSGGHCERLRSFDVVIGRIEIVIGIIIVTVIVACSI